MDQDERAAERSEDAALVERARGDDPDAFGRLYDRWATRVHDHAFRVVHDDAAAADVTQEAFLSAWRNLSRLEDVQAFGGWLLRITRNAAIDRARRDARTISVDDDGWAVIEASGPSPASAPAGFRVEDRARAVEDPARAAEDDELVTLLWESAAALGARDAEILDLGLRHGMTPAEIGEAVGLNRNAANQAVHRVRGRLKSAVEARVLWRSGEPVCAGLAAALERAGVGRFGGEAVRVTTRHAAKCEACQEQRSTRLEPSRLFGAAPFLVMPWLLKSKIAHALSTDGVPMGGSDALGGQPGAGTSARRGVLRRVVVGGGVGVVIVIVLGAFATEVGEVLGEAPVVTTTAPSAPSTSTTLPIATDAPAPTPTTTSTTRAASPPPPSPSPVPESGSASISVQQQTSGFTLVSWSSTGGSSWEASGPGLASTQPSGSQLVCNGTVLSGRCFTASGTYTYTATVRGSSGQVLAQESADVKI